MRKNFLLWLPFLMLSAFMVAFLPAIKDKTFELAQDPQPKGIIEQGTALQPGNIILMLLPRRFYENFQQ